MYYLTMKELNKYKTITEVIEVYFKAREASNILKLSERQIYRIKIRMEPVPWPENIKLLDIRKGHPFTIYLVLIIVIKYGFKDIDYRYFC